MVVRHRCSCARGRGRHILPPSGRDGHALSGGHADRQPGRSGAARGRDARGRRPDRGGGHAPHRPAPGASPTGRPAAHLVLRRERARTNGGGAPAAPRRAPPWRWSRTGACRPCPIPASGWSGRAPPRGSTSAWCRDRARRSPRSRSAGCPTDRFVFEGFLPRKAGERRARLGRARSRPANHRGVRVAQAGACDVGRGVRCARRPTGRGRTRAHEAPRGGAARAAVRAAGDARRRDVEGGGRRRDRRRLGTSRLPTSTRSSRRRRPSSPTGSVPATRRSSWPSVTAPRRTRSTAPGSTSIRLTSTGRTSLAQTSTSHRRPAGTMTRPWAATSSTSPPRSTTRTTCPTSGTRTTPWPPTSSPGSIGCAARRSSTSPAPTSTG